MIQKNFDDITKVDIDLLVANKIGEIKTLEYKQTLPGGTDKEKKEFLADISSFANASGGDLIYGIKAAVDEKGKKTGEPESVTPLQGITADEAKLQIENIVLSGIEPRIPIHVKMIDGYGDDGKGFIILVRIPQSFASPHMVKFQNNSRFFCRNSAGKYQLDVQEIRNAFLATDSQAERIRSFIRNRLAKIIANETPIQLKASHRLILHIIPLNSFLNSTRLNLRDEHILINHFTPNTGSITYRYNIDGFLAYINRNYCQLFYDGAIEMVFSNILKKNEMRRYFPTKEYEVRMVRNIKRYFQGYKLLGLEGPIVISMSLLGCKGAYMQTDNTDMFLQNKLLDRNEAIFPSVQIDNSEEEIPTIMQPIFEALWNAFGFPRCYNYTENGIWNVRDL